LSHKGREISANAHAALLFGWLQRLAPKPANGNVCRSFVDLFCLLAYFNYPLAPPVKITILFF
jgi:hypothetical protein